MKHEIVNYSEADKAEFLERAAGLEHHYEEGDWIAVDGHSYLVIENHLTPGFVGCHGGMYAHEEIVWLPTVDDLIQLPEWEFMLTPSTRHVTNGGQFIEVPDWVVLGSKEKETKDVVETFLDDWENDLTKGPRMTNIAMAKHRTLAALRAVTGWTWPDPALPFSREEE